MQVHSTYLPAKALVKLTFNTCDCLKEMGCMTGLRTILNLKSSHVLFQGATGLGAMLFASKLIFFKNTSARSEWDPNSEIDVSHSALQHVRVYKCLRMSLESAGIWTQYAHKASNQATSLFFTSFIMLVYILCLFMGFLYNFHQ